MKPYFDSCGASRTEADSVARKMIDDFNEMLQDVANTNPDVKYVDLRGIVEQTDDDWCNELHLESNKFNDASQEFHHAIQSIK
jgi:hypothetical protein